MNLDSVLNAYAKKSMKEFIEDVGDINHMPDPCYFLRDKFRQWEDEFTDSPWWDFPESDLTIQNINELLVINAKFTKEYSRNRIYSTDPPLDVDTLLRRYAKWMVRNESYRNQNGDYHFQQIWEDTWEEIFPEN